MSGTLQCTMEIHGSAHAMTQILIRVIGFMPLRQSVACVLQASAKIPLSTDLFPQGTQNFERYNRPDFLII